MKPTLDYRELIKKHNLKRLQNDVDSKLNSLGGTERDRKGRIQIGDKSFNALSHFVDNWGTNAPIIKMLFDIRQAFSENEAVSLAKMGQVIDEMADEKETYTYNIVTVNDELTRLSAGHDACAGSVMVIINTLLQGLKKDLNATETVWDNTPPSVNGCSYGQIISAGSNNFRHYDEWLDKWVEKQEFEYHQKKSVDVIAKVLNEKELGKLAKNVCGRLLLSITEGDYEKLEDSVFAFANGLAEKANTKT